MGGPWLVSRCPSCERHHGSRSPAHRCPHCGHRSIPPFPVHGEASNAGELQRMVTLANTPEDLKEELARRLDQSPAPRSPERPSGGPGRWLRIIRSVVDDEGEVDAGALARALSREGETASVSNVLEHAAAAGLLIHLGGERWKVLD